MRELRAALKRCEDAERQRELRQANIDVAEIVVKGARQRAGSTMQRSTASRIKAVRSLARAAVRLGGKPYDMGANFGAYHNVPRRRRTGTYRGYNWAPVRRRPDYMLYSSIEANRERIVDTYGDAIEVIFNKGP
jgi:hypothetical protein